MSIVEYTLKELQSCDMVQIFVLKIYEFELKKETMSQRKRRKSNPWKIALHTLRANRNQPIRAKRLIHLVGLESHEVCTKLLSK